MAFDDIGKTLKRTARDLFDERNSPHPGHHVRAMRRDDLDEVLRLIRLHDSDDYQSARHAFSAERFTLPEEVTAHIVVEDRHERRVVGVSGYLIDDDEAQGIYWLGWTYVNPFFRGQGLGKILMRHVEMRLLDLRARKLYLSTSSLEKYQLAVGFYHRCGFEQEAQLLDYYRPGEHKLLLAKTLHPAHLTPWPQPRPSSTSPTSSPAASVPPRQHEPPAPERHEEEDDEPTVFEF